MEDMRECINTGSLGAKVPLSPSETLALPHTIIPTYVSDQSALPPASQALLAIPTACAVNLMYKDWMGRKS